MSDIETVVIGGGQAGLAVSYYLKQAGREHLVLEQAARAANAWRSGRWNSFTLVTPNWTFKLPGAAYQDDQPHGYMPRAEIIARFERYIERYQLPVVYNTTVSSVSPAGSGRGYVVQMDGQSIAARNVVIATGLFQRPRIPAWSRALDAGIVQLHSGSYREPAALAPGAVLVVGSSQSGAQIAEELYQGGRQVYLSVGASGRVPRRYRGKDIVDWLQLLGFFERTASMLPSARARFAGNPHVTGKDGGHNLNLHQFARDGVVLLGHLAGGEEHLLRFNLDLAENLARTDRGESELLRQIDGYIAREQLAAPAESLPVLADGYAAPQVSELDLAAQGIRTIIWASGYTFDYSLVKLPIFDSDGYPIQEHCATAYPGLYFCGLPWLTRMSSGLLMGVGEDAAMIAEAIAVQRTAAA
ncbi:MAG: flavin-containing monooxygenase [Anaerolineae bacterium]